MSQLLYIHKGEESLFKPLDVQKSFLANQVAVKDMAIRKGLLKPFKQFNSITP